MSPEELSGFKKQIERQTQIRKEKLRREQKTAKNKAEKIWKASRPADNDHPYLKKKRVGSYHLREDKYGNLVVPARDLDGVTHTLQFIPPGGKDKKFLSGGKKSGNFYIIKGSPKGRLHICEGYATGASIHESTGCTVIVAFDAGNIKPVTKIFRRKYPSHEIILCADNDAFTQRPDGTPWNPGVEKATDAAWEHNTRLAIPNFSSNDTRPTDFNDLHQLDGTDAVKFQIEAAKTPNDLLVEAAQKDPGAPYTPQNIKRLTALRQKDLAAFMNLRARLKKAKVGVTLLDGIIKGESKSGSDPDENPMQSEAAEIIGNALQNKFAFDKEAERWMKYDGGYWRTCLNQDFREAVSKVIKSDDENFPKHYSSSYFNGLVDLLKNELPFNPPKKDKNLLPFKNGVLNLKTKEISPNGPERGFTWQLPYEYDQRAGCDPIKNWLMETVSNDKYIFQLIRVFLYAVLVGLVKVHRFLELIGPAGCGKSTLLWIAEQLVGQENTVTTELKYLEGSRFETATIYNKRLVQVTDAERYAGDVSCLKALTGGDPLRYEEKYKQTRNQFHPDAMVMIAANEAIQSSEYTSGLRRRRITVYFKKPIPLEKQRDLQGEFKPYIPGVINWLLEMSEEQAFKILKAPGSVSQKQDAKENLLETNPIAAWLDSNVTYDPECRSYIGVARKIKDVENVCKFKNEDEWLYPNYVQYCETTGVKPVSTKRFSKLVEDICQNQLGLSVRLNPKDRRGRSITGLEIRSDATQETWSPLDHCFGFDYGEGEV